MIVSDTDFLSSFAKIDELNLVFKVFKAKEIVITEAVYDELKESPLFDLLLPYKAKLLMNDKVAGRYAEKVGVKVIDIPAFLFYCKEKKILNNSQLKTIILNLKAKDFYEFDNQIIETLLPKTKNI